MERGFEVVQLQFRKFPEEEVVLPERADAGSCGYDFRSLEDYTLMPGEKHLFFTDIKVKMPMDNRLEINTRSGNGVKYGITLANTIGYIDASYYGNPSNDGNIGICLQNTSFFAFEVCKGDRIAQGCFSTYLVTDDDKFKNGSATSVRQGGFGSTGKNK